MIPKVEFKFNLKVDLFNLWQTATSSSKWHDFKKSVSQNIVNICEGKKFEECEEELKRVIKNIHKNKLIEIYRKSLEESWREVEKEYFNRMEKIFKKKFPFKKVKAYITTSGRCPYDPDKPSFMVSLFYSLPGSLNTCGHEIMHIFFHHTYWKDIEKEIGKEKTADLKEALTVILNLEFRDLLIALDQGYKSHKELREFIEKEWKKKKNFEVLLNKCVKYLKEK